MINLETTTRLGPEDALALARDYFGGTLGLTETRLDGLRRGFEGGGGGVQVSARPGEGVTIVEILSREWDTQATEFAALLKDAKR